MTFRVLPPTSPLPEHTFALLNQYTTSENTSSLEEAGKLLKDKKYYANVKMINRLHFLIFYLPFQLHGPQNKNKAVAIVKALWNTISTHLQPANKLTTLLLTSSQTDKTLPLRAMIDLESTELFNDAIQKIILLLQNKTLFPNFFIRMLTVINISGFSTFFAATLKPDMSFLDTILETLRDLIQTKSMPLVSIPKISALLLSDENNISAFEKIFASHNENTFDLYFELVVSTSSLVTLQKTFQHYADQGMPLFANPHIKSALFALKEQISLVLSETHKSTREGIFEKLENLKSGKEWLTIQFLIGQAKQPIVPKKDLFSFFHNSNAVFICPEIPIDAIATRLTQETKVTPLPSRSASRRG